jgi:hypothetical protein
MQEVETTWDPRNMTAPLSTIERIYIFFLLFVCVMALTRFVRAWQFGRSFRRLGQPTNPEYITMLGAWITSLKQWLLVTFLCLGFVCSQTFYTSSRALFRGNPITLTIFLSELGEFMPIISMTFLVTGLAFLIRWSLMWRLQNLRK